MTATESQQQYAILFADISGSTALYEKLGDVAAQSQISMRLDKIASVVKSHSGTVIKSIGDELMCCFDVPGDAVRASCEIHDVMEQQTDIGDLRLAVRIGIHFGPAIRKHNDLFGDAVNVAARITTLAKAKQTLTSAQTVEMLKPFEQAMTRPLSLTPVKGKIEMLALQEVIWKQNNLTLLHNRTQSVGGLSQRIVLKYQNRPLSIDGNDTPFIIGREDNCQLQVFSTHASRQHGKIEHRMGKFVFVDQSANGTYISLPDIDNLFIHREELPLFGSGILCCGEKIQDGNPHLIHFVCE